MRLMGGRRERSIDPAIVRGKFTTRNLARRMEYVDLSRDNPDAPLPSGDSVQSLVEEIRNADNNPLGPQRKHHKHR